MEYGSYEYALHHRCNWVSPDGGPGEVTYVGRYCVITGERMDSDSGAEYGTALPGSGQYVSVMYSVGGKSVLGSGSVIVGMYGADDEILAIANHDRLVEQASDMDMLEFVYG